MVNSLNMRFPVHHSARRVVTVVGVILFLALGRSLRAEDDHVAEHARELAKNEDFRVRTQAALALGASKSEKAVAPLCSALSDPKATVRAAAAAALGKLQKGGADCLVKRKVEEQDESVKSIIDRSISRLSASTIESKITASTRFYIAIGKPQDSSGRKGERLTSLIRSSMVHGLSAQPGTAIAPESETKAQCTKRLAGNKQVRAFLLAPKITAPNYEGGNLTIRFEVAIFTYPDKVLKGMIPIKLTQQGVTSADQSVEDELFRIAAERAVEKFMKNVERIQ